MNLIWQWATNPRTTVSVAGTTTTVGFSEVFHWIPGDIGRLAALAGFILSCVLIYINLQHHKREQKKLDLEMEILRRRLDRDQTR